MLGLVFRAPGLRKTKEKEKKKKEEKKEKAKNDKKVISKAGAMVKTITEHTGNTVELKPAEMSETKVQEDPRFATPLRLDESRWHNSPVLLW